MSGGKPSSASLNKRWAINENLLHFQLTKRPRTIWPWRVCCALNFKNALRFIALFVRSNFSFYGKRFLIANMKVYSSSFKASRRVYRHESRYRCRNDEREMKIC